METETDSSVHTSTDGDFSSFITSSAHDISPDENGSLLKDVTREGADDVMPRPRDMVTVHYVGSFFNGTTFESSRDRGEPFTFQLSVDKVIPAWNIAVTSMKKGEICRLVCKPEFGYGSIGLPPKIPPNSCLIFEIELISWTGEDLSPNQDMGIVRTLLEEGHGTAHPKFGSLVDAHIVGYLEEEAFDDRELQFNIGDGCDYDVVSGIEKALKKFKKEEKSLLRLSPKYGFGEHGSEKFKIPPSSQISYHVTLRDFSKVKEHWELTLAERLDMAQKFKLKGTEKFKSNKMQYALQYYQKAIGLLNNHSDRCTSSDIEARDSILLLLYLNSALCHIKLEKWNYAKDYCDLALQLDADNEKAHFRKGQALHGTHEWTDALEAFNTVLSINSSNKLAMNYIKNISSKMKDDSVKEKNLYHGMFERFAERDAQRDALKKAKGSVKEEPIGTWSNDMAKGMMSLHQEMEAFGECMPDRSSSTDRHDDDDDNIIQHKG